MATTLPDYLPVVLQNEPYSYSIIANGSGPFTFGMPSGLPTNFILDSDGVLHGTCPDLGTYTFDIEVTDSLNDTVIKSYTLDCIDGTDTSILRVTAPLNYSFITNQPYINFSITATGGYEPYSWAIDPLTPLPLNFQLNPSTGLITESPINTGITYTNITITDSNPNPLLVQSVTQTITFSVVEAPSQVESPGYPNRPVTAQLNVPFYWKGGIINGTPPYSIALFSSYNQDLYPLPSWLSCNVNNVDSTVELTGIPDAVGYAPVWIGIEDSNGVRNVWDVEVHIGVVDPAQGIGGNGNIAVYNLQDPGNPDFPYISNSTITSVNLGLVDGLVVGGVPPYSLQSTTTGIPGDNHLEIDANTGNPYYVGVADTQGKYPCYFTILDSVGNFVTSYTNVIIYKTVEIVKTYLPIGEKDQPYSYRLQSNYVEGDIRYPEFYDIDPNGACLLPSGFTIEQIDNISYIKGTTTFSNAFPITILGIPGNGVPWMNGVANWSTVLYIGGVVSVSHDDIPLYDSGVPVNIQFYAAGGTGPYAWSFGQGITVPDGLSIDLNTGAMSGLIADGSYALYVVAKDVNDNVGVSIFTLNVGATPPTLTDTLIDGYVNIPYSDTLVATGGIPPYSYTLFSGTLPIGLSLATGGSLTGTPSVEGSYDFTVKVEDNIGSFTLTPCNVVINLSTGIQCTFSTQTEILPICTYTKPYSYSLLNPYAIGS